MIRKNIIANTLSRVWGIISVYLFIPLYLKFLGIEAYGLVGFYTTLLGVLTFADLGFTATLNREMARLSVAPDGAEKMRHLLRTYETIYFFVSAAVGVVIWFLAPVIADRWLHSNLPPDEITTTLRLMGVAIALQLLAGLFAGGLMGLERQVRVNVLQFAWSLLRGVGAVLLLWLVSPTIIVFAAWQLLCNLLYCVSTRISLWRALAGPDLPAPGFQWRFFRETWRYAAGMAVMAGVSTILTQADKLAVSKMLPLEMLGYYTLAGAMAAVPLTLASPISAAVFPRLTGLVATGGHKALTELYHLACELSSAAIIPASLTLAFFSREFLTAWTGSPETALWAGKVGVFLLVGQLMQAVTVIPYFLALAHGNIRLNLKIGIASVFLITPSLIFLIPKFGVVGAGLSWVIMNVFTLPFYMYFLHQRFLPGELGRWITRDVGRPLLVSLACVMACRWLAPTLASRWLIFVMIGTVWALAAGASVLASTALRDGLMRAVFHSGGLLSMLAPGQKPQGGPRK